MVILQTWQQRLRAIKINLMRIDGNLEAVKGMLQTFSTNFSALEAIHFGELMLV